MFWGVYSTDLDDILGDDIRVVGISMIVGILNLNFGDIEVSNVKVSIGVMNVEI